MTLKRIIQFPEFLAKDLHDGLGGLLSGVKYSLNNMKDNLIVTPDNMTVFLDLIAEGYTSPQIAEKLFVSPFTVDSHRKNLIAKLNVKNTVMLIRFAVENKLI